MRLSDRDAHLFFDLMWGLQYFVNQKHKINDNIKSLEEYIKCSTEEKFEVRAALYSDIKIIDSYIQENPQNLSKERLDIISGWKCFVKGYFHIERFLKRCTIFIQKNEVYGVLALYQNFDEMIHRSRLPIYVQTVLLPFQGKIIYDGFFQAHNIFFGSGVKRELKESYMIAKQNNRIVESFDDAKNDSQKKKENTNKPLNNWRSELNELSSGSKKLKAKASDPAIFSPAFSLVKASIEFAQVAVSDPDDQAGLFKALNKVRLAYNKSNTVLDRQE
ncbi:hypothetical protein [Desulfonatronospira sp.]|uniref:hypothetical protein n=1 Tax=Desulfonatronospira sp. TaxID=1962951 RepID=UPI0025BDF255|nr:hypothetical protein [Desulfonatronospira sp.]